MGDRNQFVLAARHQELFRPPGLEVGSRQAGFTVSFRDWFEGTGDSYLGVDMQPGPGVDLVVDLGGDFAGIAKKLPGRFASIFCLSVLEHCRRPFQMAENLQKLLMADGVIYISVPFAWEIHDYPQDYWRFCPEGIRELFSEVEFIETACCYHSQSEGIFFPLAAGPPHLGRALNSARQKHGPVYGLAAQLLKRSRLARRVFHYDYLFPPVQLNMIGRKRCRR